MICHQTNKPNKNFFISLLIPLFSSWQRNKKREEYYFSLSLHLIYLSLFFILFLSLSSSYFYLCLHLIFISVFILFLSLSSSFFIFISLSLLFSSYFSLFFISLSLHLIFLSSSSLSHFILFFSLVFVTFFYSITINHLKMNKILALYSL